MPFAHGAIVCVVESVGVIVGLAVEEGVGDKEIDGVGVCEDVGVADSVGVELGDSDGAAVQANPVEGETPV